MRFLHDKNQMRPIDVVANHAHFGVRSGSCRAYGHAEIVHKNGLGGGASQTVSRANEKNVQHLTAQIHVVFRLETKVALE